MRPLTYELLYLGLAYPFREWADTGAAAGDTALPPPATGAHSYR